ncbi:hypothetical protein ACQJBY_053258 [Aegilops geniculata]
MPPWTPSFPPPPPPPQPSPSLPPHSCRLRCRCLARAPRSTRSSSTPARAPASSAPRRPAPVRLGAGLHRLLPNLLRLASPTQAGPVPAIFDALGRWLWTPLLHRRMAASPRDSVRRSCHHEPGDRFLPLTTTIASLLASRGTCVVLCWTVKAGKIDYLDAKTTPGPPSIVSGSFSPSTTTVVIPLRITKFNYHRREPVPKRVPLPSTVEDPVDPEHPRDMNNYFHYEMYHYRRQDCQVRLPPTCTTSLTRTSTSTTTRVQLLPLRPVNDYFPRRF